MVERNRTAQSRGAGDFAQRDALEYWHVQEITPLDSGDPSYEPPSQATEEREMVGGWWILPVLLLSIPAWIGLGALLF